MAAFDSIITNAGRSLLMEAIANDKLLNITEVKVGTGYPIGGPPGGYEALSALISEQGGVKTILSNKAYVPATEDLEGHMIVTAELMNEGLTESVPVREIGLYSGDTLFMYSWLNGEDTDNILPVPAGAEFSDTIHTYDLRVFMSGDEYAHIDVSYSVSVADNESIKEILKTLGSYEDNAIENSESMFGKLNWQNKQFAEIFGQFCKIIDILGYSNPNAINKESIMNFLNLLNTEIGSKGSVKSVQRGSSYISERATSNATGTSFSNVYWTERTVTISGVNPKKCSIKIDSHTLVRQSALVTRGAMQGNISNDSVKAPIAVSSITENSITFTLRKVSTSTITNSEQGLLSIAGGAANKTYSGYMYFDWELTEYE